MLKTKVIRATAFLFLAGIAMCFMTTDAKAQGCGYGGYGGYGGGVSVRIGGGYGGFGYGGYGRGIRYRAHYRRPVWHDTTHYDYHPGRLVPHRGHFDYVPGHHHLHRSGHWHH